LILLPVVVGQPYGELTAAVNDAFDVQVPADHLTMQVYGEKCKVFSTRRGNHWRCHFMPPNGIPNGDAPLLDLPAGSSGERALRLFLSWLFKN
jgi:hypothetical protein